MMEINSIKISDPALIRAVELLQTGDYFLVSWYDFKIVALIVGAICMIIGYGLAKADTNKIKEIKEALLG